jgi:hypothetical protein
MDTQTTLGSAREALEIYVPNGAVEFKGKMNQVLERLAYIGKYRGNILSVVFPAHSGYITLPPAYASILAGSYDRWPVEIASQWQPYFELGWCDPNEAQGWNLRLQDLGDGYVTQFDIVAPGSVRIYSTGSDNGATVRIFGTRTETGLPVTDNQGNLGEEITLNSPVVQSLYHYDDITGFQKTHTKGPVQMRLLPMGGGAEYLLSEYQTYETIPSYRRFQTGPNEKTVRVLCQRRYIPVSAETDFVIPGNIAALKFGLKGLELEDAGYERVQESQECWAQCVNWLNQEAKAFRGGGQIPIMLNAWGVGGGVPFSN